MGLTPERQVRMAVIGCGPHSRTCIQPNLVRIPLIELVAVCDLQEELAQYCARHFGARAWYTDWQTMLQREEVEAVAVIGPPSLHYEVGKACLEAGYHLFVEKPPARTVEETQEMASLAEGRQRHTLVGTMWRHMPVHRHMKAVMEREEFGRPVHLQGYYHTPGPHTPLWNFPSTSWTFLTGQGIHVMDCLLFLLGPVESVAADVADAGEGRLAYAITLRFCNGATGSLTLTSFAAELETRLQVIGSSGALVEAVNWSHLRYVPARPWLGRGGYEDIASLEWDQGLKLESTFRPGYLEELTHFAQCILRNETPHANLKDSLHAMQLCDAILRSTQTRETIRL